MKNFSFEFMSINGNIYDVEKSIDLRIWQKIITLEGTGGEITITESDDQSKSFYRVRAK